MWLLYGLALKDIYVTVSIEQILKYLDTFLKFVGMIV